MNVLHTLPDGYKERLSINLQKDKKLALLVNAVALIIGVIMAVPVHMFIPITTLFSFEYGFGPYLVRFATLMVSILVYMVLHELVHGVTMKLFGTKTVKYGFTGLYAFAGSDDYYGKGAYLTIALAPVVVWGVVLAIINALVPATWFWVVYFVQICNISGAAGDFYVTIRFAGLPRDILVRDSGVGMTVFGKSAS